ncbi:MAG: pyridoxal-phosphate dependent enzyme, partial [Cutibacterium avidum]|nr:pyridoxal-phosphate dependent enzyme [Cutibacterium avidum]
MIMTQQKRPFGVIENYRDRLPMDGIDEIVTLGEGSTPLVPVPRLGAELDSSVWIKVEGSNPTGSFKDRGMTMAMTKALADGSKAVVCASTGNTSASASAYATRAGMTPVVLLPQGKIAAGKLAQAVVHG